MPNALILILLVAGVGLLFVGAGGADGPAIGLVVILALGHLPAALPLKNLPPVKKAAPQPRRFAAIWRATPIVFSLCLLVALTGGTPLDTWPAFLLGALVASAIAAERGMDHARYAVLFLSLPNPNTDADAILRGPRIAVTTARLAVVYGSAHVGWSILSRTMPTAAFGLLACAVLIGAYVGWTLWKNVLPAARSAGENARQALAETFGDAPPDVAIHQSGPGVVSPDDPSDLILALDAEALRSVLILRRLADADQPAAKQATYAFPALILRGLDAFLQPDLKAAFYCGDGAQNIQFLRFVRLVHIFVATSERAQELSRPTHSMMAYDAILAPDRTVADRWRECCTEPTAPRVYDIQELLREARFKSVIEDLRRAKGLKVIE